MTLFYLAIAYLAGIALGQVAWNRGLIGCAFPGSWWPLFLAALLLTPLLNRLLPPWEAPGALRWPRSAGFTAPRRTLSPAVWVAIALCLASGFWRYAAHPLFPCLTPSNLAYWNAPDGAAQYSASESIIEGYVRSYPSTL